MNYTILVIDDDKPIHLMTKKMLGGEFNLKNAKNAQEAIDILSDTPVNLILTDIHMPGISGLELLESLTADHQKRDIPVLVMTNLPTIEKEKKALNLGAADFIKKEQFNTEKQKVLDLIRMKLVTDIKIEGLGEDLSHAKDQLVMKLMEKAISNSFEETVEVFCKEFSEILKSPFTAFWTIANDKNELVCLESNLDTDSTKFTIDDEQGLLYIEQNREPYMSNHIYNEEFGVLIEFSKSNQLPAEIAIPIYKITERDLLMNDMKVTQEADLFGVLISKRSKLFTSNEFELVSRLGTQAGSILWRLAQKRDG